MYLTPEIKTLFESDDLDEIGYLLRNGLDVNSLNHHGRNAIFKPECGLEKTQFLINHGLNFKFISEDGMNALFSQLNMSQPFDKFKFLIEKGVNHQQICDYTLTDTCFHFASIEIAEYLFKHLNFDIHRINEAGYNLINSSRIEVCEWLVNQKVDIFHLSEEDHNTLFCNNDNETMKYLIHLGVDPFHISKVTNENLLFHASLDDAKYLCDLGLSVSHKNKQGQTCIHEADYETLKYLVEEKGADIHTVDKEGFNILSYHNKDIDVICFAIEHNVDLFNQKIEDAYEGYHLKNMPSSFISKVCKKGLLKYKDFYKVLFTPKSHSSFPIFKTPPVYDMKSLFLYIKEYIQNGGDINILNPENNYNLLMTYGEKSEKIANFLIENGIDIHYHIRKLSVLDRCKFSSTYELLKKNGFYTHPRFRLIREIFDFSPRNNSLKYIKIRNKEVYYDLFNHNFSFDNPNILSQDYPRYHIKKFLQAGLDFNKKDECLTALFVQSENEEYRRVLSMIRHGLDVNHILKEKNGNTLSIFNYIHYFLKMFKDKGVFIFKYLTRHGLSLQKMHNSKDWNSQDITDKFYCTISDLPEKMEIFKMFKEDLNFFSFSFFKEDPDIINYLLLDSDISSFSQKNKRELLEIALHSINNNMVKEPVSSYYQKITLLMGEVKKDIDQNIQNMQYSEKPENIPVITNANYTKASTEQDEVIMAIIENIEKELNSPEIDVFLQNSEDAQSLFLNKETLLDENIVQDINSYKLTTGEENCLFYVNDYSLLSTLLKKGVNVQQTSIEGYNCFTFRLNHFIKNEESELSTEQMNILSLLLKYKVNYEQSSHYPYSVIEQLKAYNQNIYQQVSSLIDKEKLSCIPVNSEKKTITRI